MRNVVGFKFALGMVLVTAALFWDAPCRALGPAKSAHAGDQPQSQEVGPPRPYLSVDAYNQMPDLEKASRLLLLGAEAAGDDIDRVRGEPPRYATARVKNGVLLDSLAAVPFMQRARDYDGPADTLVCILKVHRVLTIRECAEFMRHGVRLYEPSSSVVFVRVAMRDIRWLLDQDIVWWIHPHTPDMKFWKGRTFEKGRKQVWIYSFEGDIKQRWQADLEQLGATDFVWGPTVTYLYIDYERIQDLAQLWWIKTIMPGGQIVTDSARAAAPGVR
ncbi:MAG TPA: hypothetical protein VFX92_01940 [Candidatus Krumholzibacteria bacterium]|nr:hypothetical protein [Candidatus Krumholzibacteria bacterium]